jgi:hypothetical protein
MKTSTFYFIGAILFSLIALTNMLDRDLAGGIWDIFLSTSCAILYSKARQYEV